MEFRNSVESDINNIMNIIKQAQEYFRKNGISQWQNNYPNEEIIKNDIFNKFSYVLVKRSMIAGTVAVSFAGEENYRFIYEGDWISNKNYAVIHRIAVKDDYKGQGLSSYMIEQVESMCLNKDVHSIRVDTHEKNISMQKLLIKNEFQFCGIIYLGDKSKRLAFEKIV